MTIGAETFYGSLETTRDALLIIEAARQGILNLVRRRISHDQKELIRHGSVFVFDEIESKMKRCGNFLIYWEAENKIPKSKSYKKTDRKVTFRDGRKEVTGSKGSYSIKPQGLIKRTLSVQIKGATHHLVSYQDPLLAKLPTPREMPFLNSLQIGNDLLYGQGFKRPLDQNGYEFHSEEEETDSRERSLSLASSIELHSVFDSVWDHNENELIEYEALKADCDLAKIATSDTPFDNISPIENLTRDLFYDDFESKNLSFFSHDLNFEEFLVMDNLTTWK